MFIIYENATKEDNPLRKCFKFDKPTNVRYANKTLTVDEGKIVTFDVKRKGKVYAEVHPVEIYTVDK